MKILVIFLVLFVILGGGAGAAWWFLMREQPEEGELAEISEEAATSLISVIRVLKLDPIVLPVIREGQVTIHITTVVVIELEGFVEQEELRDLFDPLRDAMLSTLYAIYSVRYVQERNYNIAIVRQRLGQAAEQVLGEGTVKAVRLQDITKRVMTAG